MRHDQQISPKLWGYEIFDESLYVWTRACEENTHYSHASRNLFVANSKRPDRINCVHTTG